MFISLTLTLSSCRVNDMLAEKGSRFLTGETLCCFDCELMPKLQHVRVAGMDSNISSIIDVESRKE